MWNHCISQVTHDFVAHIAGLNSNNSPEIVTMAYALNNWALIAGDIHFLRGFYEREIIKKAESETVTPCAIADIDARRDAIAIAALTGTAAGGYSESALVDCAYSIADEFMSRVLAREFRRKNAKKAP